MRTTKGPFILLVENHAGVESWDQSTKGCFAAHPLSRQGCQLPPDGHKVHANLHPAGIGTEWWEGHNS